MSDTLKGLSLRETANVLGVPPAELETFIVSTATVPDGDPITLPAEWRERGRTRVERARGNFAAFGMTPTTRELAAYLAAQPWEEEA